MKKKVLLISESMGGGLRKHVVQLIKYLNQNIYELYFIHGTDSADSAFLEEYEDLRTNAKIIPCSTFTREINFRNDIKTFLFISKKIKEIQPDIVHCHSSKAGALGRIAAKRRNVEKIFYTPHAYSFLALEFNTMKKILFTFIESILSRLFTTKTFNVSEGERDAAIKAHIDKESKFEVIYNGIPNLSIPNKKDVKSLLGLPEDKIIVGNNARLCEQKNPLFFLKTAKEITEKENDYHFVWAGSGPLQNEMKEYVKRNNLLEKVTFLGDREDSEFIVVSYDIFFISSLYEGLPYAPIEAMRAGVPIIATNVVGNREIVIENKNGFLIDETSEFIIQAKKILNDSHFSYNSYRLFKENFSLEKMIAKISQIYNSK